MLRVWDRLSIAPVWGRGSTWLVLVVCVLSCQSDSGASQEEVEDAVDVPTGGGDLPPVEGGTLIPVPEAGRLYHGVYPGHFPSSEGEEDDITLADVASYETSVGRSVAWVYFSHNWYTGREFPLATATWIRDHGSIPFVRLMLRSSPEQDIAEPVYTLEAIGRGDFDADLEAWARSAAAFGTPLLVEFGTEVNGEWFSWNGVWNGGASVGPERFRSAYRHIVTTMDGQGAANIVWVFHVDAQDAPEEAWNAFENYYPGDDVVDWVGVSAYGAIEPSDDEWRDFTDILDPIVPRLRAMAPSKPLFVLEFGVTMGNSLGDPAEWADAALESLLGNRWPEIRGFSWWNETWQNDDEPAHDSNLRVQDVPGLAEVFQARLASDAVVDRPLSTE